MHKQRLWKHLRRRASMAAWRKLRSLAIFGANVAARGILIQTLPSMLIFARFGASIRRRSPIEIPPGFLPRRRKDGYARTGCLITDPSFLGWSTVQ
jgi:hypothetical protein